MEWIIGIVTGLISGLIAGTLTCWFFYWLSGKDLKRDRFHRITWWQPSPLSESRLT